MGKICTNIMTGPKIVYVCVYIYIYILLLKVYVRIVIFYPS